MDGFKVRRTFDCESKGRMFRGPYEVPIGGANSGRLGLNYLIRYGVSS